jgi:hypothetical protein
MSESINSNVSMTQIIIFLFVFILFIIIGMTIGDNNLKISYFLVVSLALFTLVNLYLTIGYYKDLRNSGGKQGMRGPPGSDGMRGDAGVCTFSEKCGIKNCEDQVYNYIIDNDYFDNSDFTRECLENPTLQNCNNDEELLKKSQAIKPIINEQIKKCKNSRKDWKSLVNDLFPPV